MSKSLKDVLNGVKKSKVEDGSTGDQPGVDYASKAKGGQDFVKKHKTEKHADRVGNEDEPYKTSKIKHSQIKDKKHGYKSQDDESAYNNHNEETECSPADEQPMFKPKKKKLILDKKVVSERTMTAADKKAEEKLKDKYDDSGMKASMQKQYGAEKGKKVYFSYIRKKAMKE